MKKLLLSLCFFMSSSFFLMAQNLTEVVYLKNGSIIRGTVIEQVPNESLKIQTADGSIFAYSMDEVLKITKEQAAAPTSTAKKPLFQPSEREWNNDYAPKSGYAGFVDVGGGFGVGDYAGAYVEATTSHGYQIIPQLFVGAGAGVHFDFDWETISIPIFADFRYTALDNNISPIVGMKIGYSVLDLEGVYFNPSIGCRFGLSDGFAMNITFNYQMQKADFYYGNYTFKETLSNIGFKIGFEF